MSTTKEGLPGIILKDAEEFKRLRESQVSEEFLRAAHGTASEEVWLDVIHRYPELREWVAHNKTVPISILKILAKDSEPRVRFSVAVKRKLTPDLFCELAADEDEGVRQGIVYNPKVPKAILEQLTNDSVSLIREVAKSRLAEMQ
ncbi:MAG: hypothetical protein KF784_06040 [Fimbriimonadaceae bacterium]|nr:hypothetical protein [Fimbriimonadaceae bacterium]